jgi:hypothetical protein
MAWGEEFEPEEFVCEELLIVFVCHLFDDFAHQLSCCFG